MLAIAGEDVVVAARRDGGTAHLPQISQHTALEVDERADHVESQDLEVAKRHWRNPFLSSQAGSILARTGEHWQGPRIEPGADHAVLRHRCRIASSAEDVASKYGIDEYLEIKAFHIGASS
jgi:hypothetical protein